MSKDLAVLIENKVRHEFGHAKQEIHGKLSNFQEKINTLEANISKVEKSYSTAVKQSSVDDNTKLNIVIKGTVCGKNEANNQQCTVNKVKSLIRDWLKLSNVKVLKADRKDSRNSKPGLIIAKANSSEDKTLAMKAKSKLKGNKSYGNMYIEKEFPWEVRSQQNNLRSIPREIGKSDK
jgi:hypothetical protein